MSVKAGPEPTEVAQYYPGKYKRDAGDQIQSRSVVSQSSLHVLLAVGVKQAVKPQECRVDLARALAESLRQAREQASLSQLEMARVLGVSRPTLTRIENAEQNVTLRTIAQFCRRLGCGIGDLFVPGKIRIRK